MTLESVEASLLIRAERGQADLQISAGHAGDRGLSAISLAGTISTAQRQTLAIADSSASQATLQFDGILEAANLHLREVADFFGPRPVPQQLQGAVNVHSHVRAVPGVAGYDVVLSDLSANLEQLRLSGQASLAGLLTPQPTFALTFTASPIQLSQLFTTLPAEWVHPQLPVMIKDREIDGMVEVVSATVTGSVAGRAAVVVDGGVSRETGASLDRRQSCPCQGFGRGGVGRSRPTQGVESERTLWHDPYE